MKLSENYITRAEFDHFLKSNEKRYDALFNRVLGLDMVVRTLILPLASNNEVKDKVQDMIELLSSVKQSLTSSGQIALDHQQDIFFTLNVVVEMLQNILDKAKVAEGKVNEQQ